MDNQIQPNIPPIQPMPQTPITPSANWSKILLFILLGLIVFAGSVFIGIQIGRSQIFNQPPITIQPTSTVNPTALSTTTPTESNKTVAPGRRSEDVDKLKNICRNEQYQNIALQSLKYLDGKLSLITSKDLENIDPLKSYLEKTKELCKLLLSNSELQISEETNGMWNYRFIIKPFPEDVSVGYGLKFFENSWRFILPQSARL